MMITHFMINPNNGVPKFWALCTDGSCIYGSLVKRGLKTSASGGDPFKKRRNGYLDVPFSPADSSDVEVVAAIAQRTMRFPVNSSPTSPVASLIESIVRQFSVIPISLTSTGLPGAMSEINQLRNLNQFSPSKEPVVKPERPKKMHLRPVFEAGFDPTKQDYSF